MSAIAGRVLLIPKGNYDSTATYTMLDMVVYNGSSYICKQECTGVVPTNTTYWMLNASGSAVAYINDIGDVVITNVSNGQVLMYNSTTQKWVNGTLTLNGLNDTQFASLSDGQVLKYNATSQKWENAEDTGGLLPHLIIISETGESVVKAVKGTTEIIATETSTGHYECDVTEFGTWTIHAVLNGDDATVNLVVDTVKVYTVDDSHFHADITVKYPSGATCNLAGQGESYYATGSPYTFTVHHAGQYTITVVYDGQTYTDSVTVTTTGETFSKVVPSPSSVPANDINMWLWFGNVSGSYSTLADILADSTALSTLMASTDAVDYLVRCKEWITSKGLVPVMTSDTTPSGQALSNSVLTGNDAYKAFDNDTSTIWGANHVSSAYIGYDFGNPVIVNKIYRLGLTSSDGTTTKRWQYRIKYSDDGINWNNIDDTYTNFSTSLASNQSDTIIISNSIAHRYWAMEIKVADNSTSTFNTATLQFYSIAEGVTDNQSAMSYIGLNNYCANTLLSDEDWLNGIGNSTYMESVLNVKVPTMTSNTTPSGEAIGSRESTTYRFYKAFDGVYNVATDFAYVKFPNNSSPQWLGYMFETQVQVNKMFFVTRRASDSNFHDMNFVLQGSNDGTTWTDVSDNLVATIPSANGFETRYFNILNNQKYKYYRIYSTNGNITDSDSIYAINGYGLQFYGRE